MEGIWDKLYPPLSVTSLKGVPEMSFPTFICMQYCNGSQSAVPEPTASTSPGDLLEMQILGPTL